MLANIVYLFYFSVTFLVLNAVSFNFDEVKNCSTNIGFDPLEPFKSLHLRIEGTCNNSETSTCRTFNCTADSQFDTDIFWFFKPCLDDTCTYSYRNGIDKKRNFSSIFGSFVYNIKLDSSETGFLQCVANSSYRCVTAVQRVVDSGRRHLFLKEKNHYHSILPAPEQIRFIWWIYYDGYPPPKFTLYANDKNVSSAPFHKYEFYIREEQFSLYIINASKEDAFTRFSLHAQNSYERVVLNLPYNVTDLLLEMQHSINGTHAEVKCVATSMYSPSIIWHFFPCLNKNCIYEVLTETTSQEKNLHLTSYLEVNSSWSGVLRCVANNSIKSRSKDQTVASVKYGFNIIGSDDIKGDETSKWIEVSDAKNVELTCGSSVNNHSDKIKWAWLDIKTDMEDLRVSKIENTIFSNRRNLRLDGAIGTFFCKAWSKNGTLEFVQIDVQISSGDNWPYYAITFPLLLILTITAFIVVKMRTYKKLQKEIEELENIGLTNFEKGALEHLNPNLTIDDQVDLLPYDKSYEFPLERLKLSEQIGSGAFGVVVKGEANGIFENDSNTTVAVKMVNKNIGDIYIKALASELKIMIHLGKHVNVVNLIGACTKNIAKRELLVIVEYCRFGNLKDYLLNHRRTFIDQINSETGQIDFSIGSDALRTNDTDFTYVIPSSTNRSYEHQVSCASTTDPSELDKPEAASEAAGNLHYKGDYDNVNRPVCTRDLLLWSFQVAGGMEYLSLRKVLHGDLAARNILLTNGNVVKICDFGLSKSMHQQDVYKKSGDEMLPVKWMAIEAITDKIFSVQSDIWSFGVVLWEIYSLARTPYPGIEYSDSFCEQLLEGYRMKIPQFATQQIYEIMLHCWEADPTTRPSFTHLVQKIGSILDETTREHYIDMNTSYLKMNAQRFKQQNEDYLSMISAPNFKMDSSRDTYVDMDRSSKDENVTI